MATTAAYSACTLPSATFMLESKDPVCVQPNNRPRTSTTISPMSSPRQRLQVNARTLHVLCNLPAQIGSTTVRVWGPVVSLPLTRYMDVEIVEAHQTYGDSGTARGPLTEVISMLRAICKGLFEHHKSLAARNNDMTSNSWRLDRCLLGPWTGISMRKRDSRMWYSNATDVESWRTNWLNCPASLRLLGECSQLLTYIAA
ncbi:hypothetical protein BO94DRAFT_51580 [Aspergillus sclerotioniger CBS 115572]|uniref:Uncharacterized protein n=1 Tax=Aspergillus sclerotioniger CBS 115572 TaxID=1450535 RepID=A0A317WSQ3_9EURO|nr:hypothetical protein BO94DRAFT_51580 [Aspergillus sclerotioniger CBS 115572]PWY88781.1 hypothetical protein BO94DRAFT_51580 [Aspergillus sclerotioniger CBS 115572]